MSAADYLVSSTIRKGSSSRHVTSQEEVASSSYPARYIEARLHPDVISEVLERAPTPAVRAAWLEGSVVAGALNRVRIVQSRAARTHNQGSESQYQDMKVVWKESEAWWEERALESGLLPAVTV